MNNETAIPIPEEKPEPVPQELSLIGPYELANACDADVYPPPENPNPIYSMKFKDFVQFVETRLFSYADRQRFHCTLEVGDSVRVTRNASSFEGGWPGQWDSDYEPDTGVSMYVGEEGIVDTIADNGIYIKYRDRTMPIRYPFFIIELLEKAEQA